LTLLGTTQNVVFFSITAKLALATLKRRAFSLSYLVFCPPGPRTTHIANLESAYIVTQTLLWW
jgi:hypothetical protein